MPSSSQPTRRPDLVDVAVKVELQQIGRIVRWLADPFSLAIRMAKAEFGKVENTNEALDCPDRVVRPDIILNPSRKQTGLVAALAGLECAIRHEQKRTPTYENAAFLLSLGGQVAEPMNLAAMPSNCMSPI